MNEQDRKKLEELRLRRKAITFRDRGVGFLMTDAEWENYQATFCQGCGETKKNPKLWFGQEFCNECVEAFQHGTSRK